MVKCKNCFLFDKKKHYCPKRRLSLAGGRKRNCLLFVEIPEHLQKKEPDRTVYRGWWQQKLRKEEIKEFESKERRGLLPQAVQEQDVVTKPVGVLTEEDLKPVLSEENSSEDQV